MRRVMVALILLLALTLVNAVLLRQELHAFHETNFSPVHLGIRRESHYGWDMFVWREIAAVFITFIFYGIIVSLTNRAPRGDS